MECEGTILIADDDPDVIELLRTYIRPLGCELLVARDGEEALAISRERMPEVVLLDVVMPKKNGWEVCQALKGVQQTADIPIVLMTGKGDVKDRLAGLQVGADDYLVKPFKREEVVRRLSELIRKRHLRDEVVPVSPADSSDLHPLLTDPATGLPTIRGVIPRLKEVLIVEGQIGIIFVDIEQFERIEVDYGWAFFDEFLRNVADVLERETVQRLGRATVAISRIAGWNFYVFVEMTNRADGAESLERAAGELRDGLVSALRERFPQMQSARIGFFAGTTCIEYEPQIRVERQVYQGMQRAVDAVRDAEADQKRRLSRELRDIIRKKRVTTLFQPIVRSSDGSVFGYECLTRGPASSSFLNSDALFSFARETNLAWELEALALETLLDALRSTNLSDWKFFLNLEAEMFGISEFRFHEMVEFFAAHQGHFVFELTERAAIEDYAVFRGLLEKFRAKGIEIAIDDAGSGYASLEAIASLAPDYLKITKGLISTLPTEPIKQDLVRMLVDLSGRIDARTIAEGIETLEEYEWCRKLGIDLLQGYYIGRPLKRVEPPPERTVKKRRGGSAADRESRYNRQDERP
ncbi:MAG TPA: EAL domain-containing protein [Thermoanaerobaculia bacterium]|nr:EAL domain-containing protein [Thermoanaerobaculia bacterium]